MSTIDTKYIVEYIWIDATNNLRSKARTIITYYPTKGTTVLERIPEWNFDGSSTGQASSAQESEIILKPIALYKDPFRYQDYDFDSDYKCFMVLCECYDQNRKPLKSNTRNEAKDIFNQVSKNEMWYGLEQEYVLYYPNRRAETHQPHTLVGWEGVLAPESQGKYYCGVGADRTFYRKIAEEHYNKCLMAGINVSGINGEVLTGQWEYQVGPCEGIEAADQLWMSRYILHRVCEKYNIIASFDPKPVPYQNGSGLHTNFSTNTMRDKDGINDICLAIVKLEHKHDEHIKVYGDNSKRLTGDHETSKLNTFTWGIADRSTSIRIPLQVFENGCGYCEDRRPASDADPYLVTSLIAKTVLLD